MLTRGWRPSGRQRGAVERYHEEEPRSSRVDHLTDGSGDAVVDSGNSDHHGGGAAALPSDEPRWRHDDHRYDSEDGGGSRRVNLVACARSDEPRVKEYIRGRSVG
eukprot:GHVU01232598.1.p3 GENE.GHVU01232598.1~~GHVU01232598.1.p3  ORF type:complete len:105 (-),score=11.68 GHVU01232598.1:1118-1432(-)